MDLSKTFGCIPPDLSIARLHTFGLTFDTVIFIYSYLNERKKTLLNEQILRHFSNTFRCPTRIGFLSNRVS